jgi:hypothetical protein
MNATTTIQDATVARIREISGVASAVLDCNAFDAPAIRDCDHGCRTKGVCNITDADGEMFDLCLACTVPVVESRMLEPEAYVAVDVLR